MRQRDNADRKAKAQRRKAPRRRPNTPKTARQPSSPVAANETNVARLIRERDEALAQQTATADVLKVISRSTFDLQMVLSTLVESACHLCDAEAASIWRPEGDAFKLAANFGHSAAHLAAMRQLSIRPGRETCAGRVLLEGSTVHIPNRAADPEYQAGGTVKAGGNRAMLGVPLLREGLPIGVFTLIRTTARPFTEKQIELAATFADQAVIAIENVRLFEAEQQRTRELSETLEQQTATSEVLKVISSSPGELEPVFNAMLENATRICDASYGVMFLCEGKGFRTAAMHNLPRAFAEERKRVALIEPIPIDPLARLAKTKQRVHISDARTEAAYKRRFAPFVAAVEDGGVRTLLLTPLLREGALIGAFAIFRQEVRPFTGKQIEFVDNFAAQAVIAIENTRLLNELRQRTDDLSESLEQQTATSEVLSVISSSAGELRPVFETMLAKAIALCEASFGAMWLVDGDGYRTAALHGDLPEAYVEQWRSGTLHRPKADVPMARAIRSRMPVHVPDMLKEKAYLEGDPLPVSVVNVAGIRSLVTVPMLKDGEAIGVITIYRKELRSFTDKQIELVSNFAKQAVIAIENTRLLSELRESLQQQTATADVLKVISSSPGDLEPVFETMLENATRICEANFGNLFLREGDAYRAVAVHGEPDYVAYWRRQPVIAMPDNEGMPLERLTRTKNIVHIADLRTERAYPHNPRMIALVDKARARTFVAVPMLKDDELIGAIAMYRQDVRPFTDKQIALVMNFAAQAVIAIENTRLLSELRESLQQQTATADVLQVISRSPGQLEPVFKAMLENAVRICEAKFGILFLSEGDAFRTVALHGAPPAYAEARWREPVFRPNPGMASGRVARTKQPVQIADIRAEPAYTGDPHRFAILELAGARTMLNVPMLNEDELVGQIAIYRQEVRPFTDKQIELVQNFAAQAVIAIENTRLLNELRESLQQQTATADVLKVISRSAFDLRIVLRTLVKSAAQLCEAQQAIVTQRGNDGLYRLAASFGYPEEFDEYMRQNPLAPGRATTTGRVALEGKIVHIPDVFADPEYAFPKGQQLGGYRSNLGVPLLRDGVPIGAFVLSRPVVKPFSDKQIELVETFADQAVIAIENVRLLNELRELLQQQTATADVLKVISRSTFDLQTVLDTLVESAARLCEADSAAIHRPKGDAYPYVASYGLSHEYDEYMRKRPLVPGRGTVLGRAVIEGRPVHVHDVTVDPEYTLTEGQRLGGFRTVLGVPLMREGTPIGIIMLTRNTVRPFTDKQIELVTTFADQAAIAIENVRLFESVEARTRELAASLEDLRTTQDRLVQTQKLASLGQLTAGIAHEIKNPLNFVNNFSAVSGELIDDLQETLKGIAFDDKVRAEIDELTKTLRGNLDKVVQHGKRADGIVKNMLLHSREGSGEHRPVDINALVEDGLNFAYHGARAEKQGFNIKLEKSFDPKAGEADVFPQDITRVLLNLISNGFYAATKRGAETNGGDYEPTLAAATKNLGDCVEITIRDNGTGIPADVKEKMFNPFFTTKPAGEGTGLGLSISHDIVVKQHGGSIEVETQPGEFTEIKIILPRAGALPE